MFQVNDSTATRSIVENRVKDAIPSWHYTYPEFANLDTINFVTWTDYPGSIPAAELDPDSPIPGAHKKIDYNFDVNATMTDGTTKTIPVIATIEFE